MAWYGRGLPSFTINVDSMVPAFSEKFATVLYKMTNQFASFHKRTKIGSRMTSSNSAMYSSASVRFALIVSWIAS